VGVVVGLFFQFLVSVFTFLMGSWILHGEFPWCTNFYDMSTSPLCLIQYALSPWLIAVFFGAMGGLFAAFLHLFADSLSGAGIFLPHGKLEFRPLAVDMFTQARETIFRLIRPKQQLEVLPSERPTTRIECEHASFRRARIAGFDNNDFTLNTLLGAAGALMFLSSFRFFEGPLEVLLAVDLAILALYIGSWRSRSRSNMKQSPREKPTSPGSPLARFCDQCGKELKLNSRFCDQCGRAVAIAEEIPA
jgi:hypothetical protein